MFYYQNRKRQTGDRRAPEGTWPLQPSVTALQNLLTYCLIGLSQWAKKGLENGLKSQGTGMFTAKALTATHGDAAADPHRLIELIQQTVVLRDQIKDRVPAGEQGAGLSGGPGAFEPATTLEGLLNQAVRIGADPVASSPDTLFFRRFLLCGIRSVAVYMDHAGLLGYDDAAGAVHLFDTLNDLYRSDLDARGVTARIQACGKAAVRAMTLLDNAGSQSYGRPSPVRVRQGPVKGKAILVSGRDFQELEALLRQSESSGIKVYTHGEMLDAHQYPGLQQYPQFCGHYQGDDHEAQSGTLPLFPGPVILTPGSLVPRKIESTQHLFTTGPLNRPGIPQIVNRNFKPVLDQALAMEGFRKREDRGATVVGNDEATITGAAEEIARRLRNEKTSRVHILAGCLGPVAGSAPRSASGKGELPERWSRMPEEGRGILLTCDTSVREAPPPKAGDRQLIHLGHSRDPRVIVQIVAALSVALETEIEALPLSLGFSWAGQKAAGVLLALLSLGLDNIRLGPVIPSGITPDLAEWLREGGLNRGA